MNPYDSVCLLGHNEGLKLRIGRSFSDINTTIPYFHIQGRDISIGGHIGHDNQDRLPFFAQYLKSYIFPHLDKDAKLDGYYNIELHDTYSYLKNNTSYDNCMTWSKRKMDQSVVLLPDLYQLMDYGGKLAYRDVLQWEDKNTKIGFWGTTTGDRDPLLNKRLQICKWGLNHKEETDFYITKIAQMNVTDVVATYPEFPRMSKGFTSPDEMFMYNFLLDVPGNTCSWDRVPQVLNSNSLLFKMPCQDMCFYYPLLHDGTHYMSIDEHNMLQKRTFCLSNPSLCKFISANAQNFAKTFLNSQMAKTYLVALFESCSYRNAK